MLVLFFLKSTCHFVEMHITSIKVDRFNSISQDINLDIFTILSFTEDFRLFALWSQMSGGLHHVWHPLSKATAAAVRTLQLSLYCNKIQYNPQWGT